MSLLADLFETEYVSFGRSLSRNIILMRNASQGATRTIRIRLYGLLLASLAVLAFRSSEKAGFQLMIAHHPSLHELLRAHSCQNVSDVYCTIFANRNIVGPNKLTVVVS
jgi:hypothetical protein